MVVMMPIRIRQLIERLACFQLNRLHDTQFDEYIHVAIDSNQIKSAVRAGADFLNQQRTLGFP